MSIPKNLQGLTALFKKLGAPDPDGWARSQVEERIPQLGRYLFLRKAWGNVVPDDDPSWIDAEIARANKYPDESYAGAGHALARMRTLGVTDDDVTALVRAAQVGERRRLQCTTRS